MKMTKKSRAPFGVATKRFIKVGLHPELDATVMKRENVNVGPTTYCPKLHACKFKTGLRWDRELELEEFSRCLGYRNYDVLYERKFFSSLRGPGTQDIDETFYSKQTCSVKDNVGFGTEKRFSKSLQSLANPAPGTYTPIQYRRPSSNLPTFEHDGFVDRFKRQIRPYHLTPNRYQVRDEKSTADIFRKLVSRRGPYDLFTGPRDGTTIKNHFGTALFKVPDYFHVPPSDVNVLLHHSSKKRYGRFLAAERFQKKPTTRALLNDLSMCYRSPDEPGPAHYDLSTFKSIRKKPESVYPFGTSNPHSRPPVDWSISPGPGRYNPKRARCMRSRRPSWVFLSKQPRELFKVVDYRAFWV
ncbi:ciliary microtubule-associated protein 2 [Cylas formicarius]|uniref:ciliary microtubule-associated protein 2 n=1 Tax=Cylas formicarius TaxID=197179 RepID=UPI00295846A9|nr:ciliary microtubule-associated protein 2 [Cylas formicarius]